MKAGGRQREEGTPRPNWWWVEGPRCHIGGLRAGERARGLVVFGFSLCGSKRRRRRRGSGNGNVSTPWIRVRAQKDYRKGRGLLARVSSVRPRLRPWCVCGIKQGTPFVSLLCSVHDQCCKLLPRTRVGSNEEAGQRGRERVCWVRRWAEGGGGSAPSSSTLYFNFIA